MLLVRGHEEDRVEALEYVRAICYYSSLQFHKPGTKMQDLFSLPTDELTGRQVEKEELLALMDKVTQSHKKKYNIQ